MMHRTVLVFLLVTGFYFTRAQELVPNGGFESHRGMGKCAPWTAATGNFNHFYHRDLNIKQGGAARGKGYFALCMYGLEENEFLHVKLLQPLQKGKVYKLSMQVRMSDSTDDVFKNEHLEQLKRLDWYFTSIPINVEQKLLITAEPSASFSFAQPHPQIWTLLEIEYVAQGYEKYLTIGNITRMYELMNVNPELAQMQTELTRNGEKEDSEVDSVKAVYKAKMDPPMQNPDNAYSMNPYIKTKVSKKKQKAYRAHVEKNNRIRMDAYTEEKKIRQKYASTNYELAKKIEAEKGNNDYYKVNVCFDEVSILEITGKTAAVEDPLLSMEAVTGNTLVLKNVYFDTDAYALLSQSFTELDKLVDWLNQHPETRIQVNGHTDNTGSGAHNLNLSNNRAQAVMQYLVNKGIDSKRIQHKGYAAMFPLADNTSEQGKALNRRVEFTVL